MGKETFLKLVSPFPEHTPPLWSCSTCGKGILEILEPTLKFEETGPSRLAATHEAFDYDWVEMRFSGLLKCSNKLCGDVAAIAGKAGLEENCIWETQQIEYYKTLTPQIINPPPQLFPVIEGCGEAIKASIIRSFTLVYIDTESCSNAIRVAVELIMDHYNIPKISIKNGKRSRIKLHTRIEKFKTKNAEVANLLLAVKWIGNTGSHAGRLSKEDIFDAYEILEQALNSLFSTSARRARVRATQINKRRGPINR